MEQVHRPSIYNTSLRGQDLESQIKVDACLSAGSATVFEEVERVYSQLYETKKEE